MGVTQSNRQLYALRSDRCRLKTGTDDAERLRRPGMSAEVTAEIVMPERSPSYKKGPKGFRDFLGIILL